jgi:hypothetical protein
MLPLGVNAEWKHRAETGDAEYQYKHARELWSLGTDPAPRRSPKWRFVLEFRMRLGYATGNFIFLEQIQA